MPSGTRTDDRSDTRSRVVDVAARLLQEQGPAAVTTRGVAQGAGVQAPVIYRLFGDKDGLLDAVAEHVMSTYVSAKSAVAAAASAGDVDPLEDLRAGWRTQMDFGLANPTLVALLSVPGRGPDSPAAQAGLDVLRARVRRVAAAGRLRVSERRAVDLIHAAGTGAVLTLLATPPDRRDHGLADAMFEAVLREILTDAPAVGGGGPTPAAVALRAEVGGLEALSEAEQRLLAEWLDRAIDAAASSHPPRTTR
jgi:AcrR family transcriptional regulator